MNTTFVVAFISWVPTAVVVCQSDSLGGLTLAPIREPDKAPEVPRREGCASPLTFIPKGGRLLPIIRRLSPVGGRPPAYRAPLPCGGVGVGRCGCSLNHLLNQITCSTISPEARLRVKPI